MSGDHLVGGHILVASPAFWTLVVITVCIVLPWLFLRRVAVRAETLSKYAVHLYLTYTTTPVCAAVRLSNRSL